MSLHVINLYFTSSVIAYCISPYATFYAGLFLCLKGESLHDSSNFKKKEITAEIAIFVLVTVSSYYDSLLNSKNYILQTGDVILISELVNV